MTDLLTTQREVARIALEASHDAGFALAGSGAVREHGMTRRLSEDVDLFTPREASFGPAVDHVAAALSGAGYQVEQTRRTPLFCRFVVSDGDVRVELDLGVDWRKDDPSILEIGPVLSVEDAVGNKVAALFSRGEPRDYLDVDTIRLSGRFTDPELLAAAAERDLGFDVALSIEQLQRVGLISLADIERYGLTAQDLDQLVERTEAWASDLRRTFPRL